MTAATPTEISTSATTMIAIKKDKAEAGLTLHDDVPIPTIGPRDVLVAVTHTGICGTDRHIYEWDAWSAGRIPLGISIGHELVGRVVKIGEGVLSTKIGDRVSAEGHIGCGVCHPCRTGFKHICEDVSIFGVDRDGCFAQFISVPEENLWRVHVDIPDHIAAIFDPLGNAMHTVMAAGVSGRSVLITGVGIIGVMAVAIARAAGATSIFVTDMDSKRLELATELGADHAFLATDQSWPNDVKQLTSNLGCDVLLEMSGNRQAIRDGFKALRNGGTAALLGIPAKEVSFNLAEDIIFKGATVLGINGRRMFETWYQVENFLLTSKIDFNKIITHQIDLQDFETGFQKMQSGEAIKVVMRVPQKTS